MGRTARGKMTKVTGDPFDGVFDKAIDDERFIELDFKMGDCAVIMLMLFTQLVEIPHSDPRSIAILKLASYFIPPMVGEYPETEKKIAELIYRTTGHILVIEK